MGVWRNQHLLSTLKQPLMSVPQEKPVGVWRKQHLLSTLKQHISVYQRIARSEATHVYNQRKAVGVCPKTTPTG